MTATPMGVRDVLRIRDYRNLFAGQVVSDIGDGITLLLVLLVINDLTGSTFALALMAIAEAVPAFTVGLAAGVAVPEVGRAGDREHRPAVRRGRCVSRGVAPLPDVRQQSVVHLLGVIAVAVELLAASEAHPDQDWPEQALRALHGLNTAAHHAREPRARARIGAGL